MRIKAKNPPGSPEYYQEPYTLQHLTDWLRQLAVEIPQFLWYVFRHLTSRKFRIERAREYNQLLFGGIPTSQIYVPGEDGHYRQLRPEERTWPE
jgi:hypothetical protein